VLDSGAEGPGFKSAPMSGNSLRQTVHTHRASVHRAAKLVAALLRVTRVTAGLAESNVSLPPGLWLTSRAGWLQRTGISSGTLRSVIEHGLPLYFIHYIYDVFPRKDVPLAVPLLQLLIYGMKLPEIPILRAWIGFSSLKCKILKTAICILSELLHRFKPNFARH